MSEEDHEAKKKRMKELVKEAHDKLKQAENISEDIQEPFSFDLAYGMGGTYYPESWKDSDSIFEDSGWLASSELC